jgi:hypothetical protein
MHRYLVQSGPLSITLAAPSAYEAALEAVRWWDDRSDGPIPKCPDAAHRAQLAAETEVSRPRSSRVTRVFPTFKLLARASGRSQSEAWQRAQCGMQIADCGVG